MEPKKDTIEATLTERGAQYGSFARQTVVAQELKRIMREAPKWGALAPDQKEALEMIATKISRILNGNPDHHDGWHDAAGYAKLVADRLLTGEEK